MPSFSMEPMNLFLTMSIEIGLVMNRNCNGTLVIVKEH
jgi:hypothetical protein